MARHGHQSQQGPKAPMMDKRVSVKGTQIRRRVPQLNSPSVAVRKPQRFDNPTSGLMTHLSNDNRTWCCCVDSNMMACNWVKVSVPRPNMTTFIVYGYGGDSQLPTCPMAHPHKPRTALPVKAMGKPQMVARNIAIRETVAQVSSGE